MRDIQIADEFAFISKIQDIKQEQGPILAYILPAHIDAALEALKDNKDVTGNLIVEVSRGSLTKSPDSETSAYRNLQYHSGLILDKQGLSAIKSVVISGFADNQAMQNFEALVNRKKTPEPQATPALALAPAH